MLYLWIGCLLLSLYFLVSGAILAFLTPDLLLTFTKTAHVHLLCFLCWLSDCSIADFWDTSRILAIKVKNRGTNLWKRLKNGAGAPIQKPTPTWTKQVSNRLFEVKASVALFIVVTRSVHINWSDDKSNPHLLEHCMCIDQPFIPGSALQETTHHTAGW